MSDFSLKAEFFNPFFAHHKVFIQGNYWLVNGKKNKKELLYDALKIALLRQRFPVQVTIPTDCGSQYGSIAYRRSIKSRHLIDLMSRKVLNPQT